MGITRLDLLKYKQQGQKIVVCTAYDATFARIQDQSGVDILLVGDSLGMVLKGDADTLSVTLEQIIYHTQAVKKGAQRALVMVDVPFMGFCSLDEAYKTAKALMMAGAHMIKVEAGDWLVPWIKLFQDQGVPICAHLGLTPQSVHQLGGFKVQGKTQAQAELLLQQAQKLDQAGVDLLLLECVPQALARQITQSVSVPVIGIGAGVDCDGQVLVMHDLLGLNPKPARFVRNFINSAISIEDAFVRYVKAVQDGSFPSSTEAFD
jgi:3-methyl-2-oxobutanoate hydroxymethyltransferase